MYTKRQDRTGTLNENFWAAFYATLNEIRFENRENEFYKYNDKIYEAFSTHLLMDQISNDIFNCSCVWPGYEALAELRNARQVTGVVTQLKGKVQKEGMFSQRREYIHVANGVLLTQDPPVLVPFGPQWVSRNLIPIDYIPGAKRQRFIDELLAPLSADDIIVLQKMVGMFLSGTNFLQKILILQGAPGSGKSALAAVIRLLIGERNCGELRTAHLDERFEMARYMAKILLIGADVAGNFLNLPGAHKLKEMTGGDWIELERKYSNLACAILGIFCVLITCNSRLTIKLNGDRGAWLRRLIILSYEEKKHVKDIPHFAYKLVKAEGPGILNWALEGLRLANADVEKYGTIGLSAELTKRAEALLNESEGLRLFVENRIVADKENDLTTDEILREYADYCAQPERGWNINTRALQRQLPDIMLELFKAPLSTNIVRDEKRHRGYRFVTLANDNPF
jgi:phage/plasmid-associated DNA primase